MCLATSHPFYLLVCLVFDEYEKIAEVSVEDSIKSELSGDFERLMLAVGKKPSNMSLPFHAETSELLI